MQNHWFLGVLLAGACATRAPSVPTTTPEPPPMVAPACELGDPAAQLGPVAQYPASELVARLGSGVDTYRLQDGLWLARSPVMVNEPFDFAQAMALGAIGAGLAAATRQKHNHERAAQLADKELSADAARRLDELRACGIQRWVLSWGSGEKAETHVFTERYDARGKRLETRERVLPGDVAFDSATWLAPADDGALVPARSEAVEPSPPGP